MPLDTNVFDKLKTFTDYKRAEDEFQARKALQQQAIQTGGIDAASKANIYKTQLLSGAAAGGQGAFDQARQTLQAQGIDTSEFAPDVQTATQQLQQARLAQSPLGSLLNAGLKAESNGIAATAAMGSTQAGAQLDPLSNALIGKIAPALGAATGAAPQANVAPVQSESSKAMISPARSQQNQATITDLYPGQSPAAQPVVLTEANPARFSPPPQNSGETNQAYNQRVQNAFNAFKEDPSVISAQEGAKVTANKTANVNVDRQAGYTKAQSALQGFEQQSKLVTDNIDKAMATINPYSTGYGSYLSGLPNTDARKLNNYLNTIKANVGFDKLQSMRDNSPTGGALGQVSDMENKLLQAVNGALDPGQEDQLKENLQNIKVLYPQVLAEKQRAFSQDYGGFQPIGGNQQAAPSAPVNNQPSQPVNAGGWSIQKLQ